MKNFCKLKLPAKLFHHIKLLKSRVDMIFQLLPSNKAKLIFYYILKCYFPNDIIFDKRKSLNAVLRCRQDAILKRAEDGLSRNGTVYLILSALSWTRFFMVNAGNKIHYSKEDLLCQKINKLSGISRTKDRLFGN